MWRNNARRWQVCGLTVAGLLFGSGCARELTITQDNFVNTASQIDRPPQQRTGVPLELAIVCVYEKDLERSVNSALKPGSGITSDIWFKKRPLPGDDETDASKRKPGWEERFQLSTDQIFLLTNDEPGKVFGKRIANALRGAQIDGKQLKKKFEFSTFAVHNRNSVIYVFGRFSDNADNTLPVKPAIWNPPGDYTEALSLHIGVDEGNPRGNFGCFGQYLENTTPPRLNKGKYEKKE